MSLINHRWPSFRNFFTSLQPYLYFSPSALKSWKRKITRQQQQWNLFQRSEIKREMEIKRKHYGWVGILIVLINIVTPSAPFDLDSPRSFSSCFLPHFFHWLQLMILPNRRLRHFLRNLCLLSIKSFPIHFHYHFNL